jgi:hypothetical protein
MIFGMAAEMQHLRVDVHHFLVDSVRRGTDCAARGIAWR